jgi:hypothetical protein
MLEPQFYGKLLPSHPDIMPILLDVRKKYQIPEISPSDNGFKILIKHDLETDSDSTHRLIPLPQL